VQIEADVQIDRLSNSGLF